MFEKKDIRDHDAEQEDVQRLYAQMFSAPLVS